MLRLYYTPGACSLASHIALEEASAHYEVSQIDFERGDQRRPEFLAINPKARVPVLVTDRGVLTENVAILTYVAQTHPQAQLCEFGDPFAFAELQSFNAFIASSLHVTMRQVMRPDDYADGETAAQALRAKVPEKADEYFALIERRLEDGRPWVHGERYTVSDPYLFVYACHLELSGGARGNPEKFPLVRAHRLRVRERPAVAKVLANEGLKGW